MPSSQRLDGFPPQVEPQHVPPRVVAEGVEAGLRVAAVVGVELGVDDLLPVEDRLLQVDACGVEDAAAPGGDV